MQQLILTEKPVIYKVTRIHPGYITIEDGIEMDLSNYPLLMDWALFSIMMFIDEPSDVEFGLYNNRAYAEFL